MRPTPNPSRATDTITAAMNQRLPVKELFCAGCGRAAGLWWCQSWPVSIDATAFAAVMETSFSGGMSGALILRKVV